MVRETQDERPEPGAIKTSGRWSVSLVWIVPIIALLVGISLVVHNRMQAGPEITITFKTGEGLVADKTQVKYRNVVIGHVSRVELSEDQKSVAATVELVRQAGSFIREDAKYWVVRPRIGAGGVSGIDTLLSGAFIGADSGVSERTTRQFIGLETPPPITYGEPGKRFTLATRNLASLEIGSPVYYHKIPVGQVVGYALDKDGKGVDVEVFINAPNDAYVTRNTRFWNASGIEVGVSANGFNVKTESLSAVLIGGVAFGAPEYGLASPVAAEGDRFDLFSDEQTALAPPPGKAQYLSLRFNQALRGLKVDAPVEFQGVEIGKVVSVNLDFDLKTSTFPIIVGIVIYPESLGEAHTKMLKLLNHDPNDLEGGIHIIGNFVEHGLRAQARSGNLLTGQLYISLDFYPKAEKVAFDPSARPVMLPTVPGSLELLQEQLQAVVEKISRLPLDRIANNLDGSLNELRNGLKQFNGQTLPGIRVTLDDVRKTLKSANSTLAEDSPQREQLGEAIDELGRMSRSLRDLSDYLGRHPESLIRGRPKASRYEIQKP
jgi:paraquat-inducible protein B